MHFFLKLFLTLILVQIISFLVWWRRLDKSPRFRPVLIGLFVAGNLPWYLFYAVADRPDLASDWLLSVIIRLFITWQAGLFLWLYFAAILALALLIFYRIPRAAIRFIRKRKRVPTGPDDEKEVLRVSRREFLVRSAGKAVWGMTLGGAAYGFIRSEFAPTVVSHTVSVRNLPESLDGLTIAHLSDLHIGVWTSPNQTPQVMALTRDLRPDMVVLTGDIIDHNPSFSQALLRYVPYLKQVPLGVFAVIGNHDIYTGADKVSQALESGGIVMLRNAHYSLKHQGLPLSLVGVDDPGRRWFGSGGMVRLDRAMSNMERDLFPILLVHRPTGFDQAKARDIPLTLCGHTHGGQFGLPGGPNLANIAYEYTHGLYKKGESILHVSAGIGSVGLPFRLGVPPEVGLLTLKRS